MSHLIHVEAENNFKYPQVEAMLYFFTQGIISKYYEVCILVKNQLPYFCIGNTSEPFWSHTMQMACVCSFFFFFLSPLSKEEDNWQTSQLFTLDFDIASPWDPNDRLSDNQCKLHEYLSFLQKEVWICKATSWICKYYLTGQRVMWTFQRFLMQYKKVSFTQILNSP